MYVCMCIYIYIYIYIIEHREGEREIETSRSCRCAIMGVPWCLRMLSLFSTRLKMRLTNESPQAKHAETDPRHGTPAMAHFQPPEVENKTDNLEWE